MASTKDSKSIGTTKTLVTDSRFFSQEFNTAIIDGPLRIYFSAKQEQEALHIYFEVQQFLADRGLALNMFSHSNPHFYLMLYPTKQSFINVFSWEDSSVYDRFQDHLVLGLDSSESVRDAKELGEEIGTHFEFAMQSKGRWPTSVSSTAHAEVAQ